VIRTTLPVLITSVTGILLVMAFFSPAMGVVNTELSEYFNIIAAVAFILGGGNLLRVHLDKIYRKRKGWLFSIVTVGGFLLTLVAGLFKIGNPQGWEGAPNTPGTLFNFTYDAMFDPLQSTMFSLLAFFVASASYRAFRARNTEASLLLGAALIILLGRTFVGVWLTAWLPEPLEFLSIPSLWSWIMSTVNLAGQRAILIGIGLGVISTSLKIILGIERSYLGSRES
jgi:hypothetical protein